MTLTKKRVYRRKPNSKKNKRKTRRTIRKRMKLKIKNLGKRKSYKRKSYKRIQYGCSKKNMKGGGPMFQPITDLGRNSDGASKMFFNSFMGNDPKTNEVIVIDPAGKSSNFNNSN